jgi:quercetin dioxygenase-like cupin family protein
MKHIIKANQNGFRLGAALVFGAALVVTQIRAKADSEAAKSAVHSRQPETNSQPFSINFKDLKWQTMFPEFGKDSPEISMLRVDPKTHATQLLIRTPSAVHVPKHWHSANETHTVISGTFTLSCGGRREALGPGSFNYMPAELAHEAWMTPGTLLFITVDAAWDIKWVNGPPTKSDIGVAAPATSE